MRKTGYLAVILIILGSWLVIDTRENNPVKPTTKAQDVPTLAKTVLNTDDKDSDSLKDWEETLWGTNPEVKDTDGDGTNDGEEVKVGRDPRVKGPGDIIDESISQQIPAKTPDTKISTNTNTPGKNTSTTTPKSQSLASTRKGFANSVATIIADFTKGTPKDAEIIEKATKTPTLENIAQVKVSAERYHSLVNTINTLKWPDEKGFPATAPQNTLSQSFAAIANALDALSSYKTEGKIPISAVKQYNKVAVTQLEALVDLAHFFKNEGITFTYDDPGYIFANLSAIIKK